jgi:hypothetical protein
VGSVQASAGSLNKPALAGSIGSTAQPVRQKTGIRELWAAWKKIARKIGDFQARVLLTIFYFVLLAPFALIVRRTSDPLAIKAPTQRGWGFRSEQPEYTMEMAHRQF